MRSLPTHEGSGLREAHRVEILPLGIAVRFPEVWSDACEGSEKSAPAGVSEGNPRRAVLAGTPALVRCGDGQVLDGMDESLREITKQRTGHPLIP